jgi:hypothetical protein
MEAAEIADADDADLQPLILILHVNAPPPVERFQEKWIPVFRPEALHLIDSTAFRAADRFPLGLKVVWRRTIAKQQA